MASPPVDTDELRTLRAGGDIPPTLRLWYRMDRDKADEWRIEAEQDYDFVAGRQYTADEIAILNKKKRPVAIFNRIGTIVDAVTGYEIGNRREVRYIPREMGDVQANELYTAAGQWFNDECKGDFVRSAIFADTIICGMGWSETRIDFTESPNGEPRKDHLDPFEMAWDRDARGRNLADATRIWRARRIPLSEAEGMFQDYTKAELDASWSNINSEADLKRKPSNPTQGDGEYVTIIQCQYIVKEPYILAVDPLTNEEAEFTEKEFDEANKRLKLIDPTLVMEGVTFRKKRIKQAFLGGVVLSYGDAPCPKQFSMQCVTGKYDRNKGTWYGLVRAMKDPQRWANKWLAQMMHIMNSNAKGGLMAEKRAFDDPRAAQRDWADPDSITIMNDGAISNNAIKEKMQAPFPAGFQQLTEFAITSIRDVSGVNQELLGLRDADQPGVLEAQRKQAGMNILQWAFDGMKLYSERDGEVILYYLQNDLSDGRLIRIVGKDMEKFVPLAKQADVDYDIIVDDAPTSPNQKEQIWGIVSSFIPLMGKVIPPQYILKALKFSPLPSSIVSELEEMANAPNPQAQREAEMRARLMAAEIAEKEGKGQSEQARAEIEMQKLADAQQQRVLEWRRLELDEGKVRSETALQMAEIDERRAETQAQLSQAERESVREILQQERESVREMTTAVMQAQERRDTQIQTALIHLKETMEAPNEIVRDANNRPVGTRKVKK